MRNARVLNCWCVALVLIPAALWAASPSSSSKTASPAKTVDLFAGMEAGDVEAVMIMADSTKGTVMVKNKTDQPLTIKIPAALAGVPILAQRGGGMGGRGGGGMGGMGGGMQGMGGGMMGGGMGGGMMGGGMGGMGGGMFNVAPDKVQKVKIAAVCLDHGLTDPSPRVPYKPIPIESYVKDPAVAELIKLLTAGQIDQHSAQAAAWHLQNGLTWDELAQKIGVKHINGTQEPYFEPHQLQRALAGTRLAKTMSENAAKESSPGKSPGDELAGKQ